MKEKFDLPEDMYFEKDGEFINIMDIEPDLEILALAKEYDKKNGRNHRKQGKNRLLHVAALVTICFVSISAITLESSDALRLRIYRIFSNEEDGSVTLSIQGEDDYIGDWQDYWYPEYLPEGITMEAAEKSETEKIMLFSSEDGIEICILECPLDTVTAVDTDYSVMEEIKAGYYRGYLLVDEEHNFSKAFLPVEDRQICVEATGLTDRDGMIKIVQNLKYRKK